MGFGDILKRLFSGGSGGGSHGIEELARRLDLTPEALAQIEPAYESFEIPKRSGGRRHILAPRGDFKEFQRRLHRRLLTRLSAHRAAHGFERRRSIVTHARRHTGKAVVVHLDIQEFFPSTSAARVKSFFRQLGWNKKAASLLTTLCTWEGGLPQGAPTSPRLSNLVNRRLDARLEGLAARMGASYSRYADDMTFSWQEDRLDQVRPLISLAATIVADEGYRLHRKKKLRIMRRHDRQQVTGLVVNERVNLPRKTRRWLRAVAHRQRTGGPASLTEEQLDGWMALKRMVEFQREH